MINETRQVGWAARVGKMYSGSVDGLDAFREIRAGPQSGGR